MSPLTRSMLLVVVSNVIYHLSQKSIPKVAHPLISVLVSYGVALILALALLPFFPSRVSFREAIGQLNWASFTVGLAIVGVEVGFLLVYRSGWKVGIGAAISNTIVVSTLLLASYFVFNERITVTNLVGLGLCAIGLCLVVI